MSVGPNWVWAQQTANEAFFIEIPNFWAWTDNLGREILEHLGYFFGSFVYVPCFQYKKSRLSPKIWDQVFWDIVNFQYLVAYWDRNNNWH